MSNGNNGGPAFPIPDGVSHFPGMTLRDYFAAKAIAPIMLHPQGPSGHWETIASQAYAMADAMLAERAKP